MIEQRLFRLAHEDIFCNAHHEPGRGWSLRIGMRRQGESWEESSVRQYECLSTAELLSVLTDDVQCRLSAT